MYRSKREQLRITDFFRNNNDLRMARDTSYIYANALSDS
jgi:hypothetical protein